MIKNINRNFFFLFFPAVLFFSSCKSKHAAVDKQIVTKPADMDEKVNENIREVLQYAVDNNVHINDSIQLHLTTIVRAFYKTHDYKNIWSQNEQWLPQGDSIYNFIQQSEMYGLFPSDYHFKDLLALKNKLLEDSISKSDAIVWTKIDLMLTDGFMQIAKHLKEGRLLPDSISLSADTALAENFFYQKPGCSSRQRQTCSCIA